MRGHETLGGTVSIDPGSFRDSVGRVYLTAEQVFRTVAPSAWPGISDLHSSGVICRLIRTEKLWPARILEAGEEPLILKPFMRVPGTRVLEHPVLPFVSYPYEWPFSLAKRAALHHIDLHLELLDHGFSLIDGSAYNIQFVATRPFFIDTLSLVPYADGDYWLGYRQFCTQFLNPLLIMAKLGVGYHAWFRGALEGIAVEDAARLLPWYRKLSWGTFSHVGLHARLIASMARKERSGGRASQQPAGLRKSGLIGLLRGLRRMIARLQPKGLETTVWRNYEGNTSYDNEETNAKRAFVADFLRAVRPTMLWDLGCNTGAYSELALANGTERVIGFDFDLGALEAAVSRADDKDLDLLPLLLDAANPSPRQGWRQRERAGLEERANAKAILALAFLHHLVIGKNIPLEDAVDWLVQVAPTGVIEFVPKKDPMVRRMLAQRKDIFYDYDIETFRQILSSVSCIQQEEKISDNGRTLFIYRK